MPKKMKKDGKADVHEELDGFNIKVNEFGEMVSNISVDKLNDFLNEKIVDKKLDKQEEE